MKVIAHRGDSHSFPENTIVALKSAIASGADIVEYDVQITKDKQLVVFHDRDCKRIAGIDLGIADMELEEVKRIDVGKWKGEEFRGCRVPSLEEVLTELSTKVSMILEIKPQGRPIEEDFFLEQTVLESLDQRDVDFGSGYISVRTIESLNYIREHSSYPVGLMQKKRTPEEMNQIVEENGIEFSQIRWMNYDISHIASLKETGTKITCFYADTTWQWGVLRALDVYGTLTNCPGEMKQYFRTIARRGIP